MADWALLKKVISYRNCIICLIYTYIILKLGPYDAIHVGAAAPNLPYEVTN